MAVVPDILIAVMFFLFGFDLGLRFALDRWPFSDKFSVRN